MAKIFLVFSDSFNISEVGIDDVIISVFEFQGLALDQQIKVNHNDIDLNDYRDDLEILRMNFIHQLSDPISSDVFDSSFNNFYNHIFRSIFKWIKVIKEVLVKHKGKQIVISDLVYSDYYLPYYEAEGEINQALYYKQFDFIPQYLLGFLNHAGIKVTISKKHSSFMLCLRIFVRRYILFGMKLCLGLKAKFSYMKNVPSKTFEPLGNDDPTIILLSRGIPHTQYFLPYFEIDSNSIFFISDGIKSYNKNLKLSQDLKLRGVSYLSYLSVLDYFKVFLTICNSLGKTISVSNKTDFHNVTFNFRSCLREMLIGYFEVKLYEIALIKFLQQLKSFGHERIILISGEMFTPYTKAVKAASLLHQCKSLQLQTSLMDYWPQTRFVFCDKFLFTSYQALEFYKKNNPIEVEKYDFWGRLSSSKQLGPFKKLKSILYFSQPYENEIELEIVEYLVKELKILGINLFIKLHPRDSKSKFKTIKGNIFFIESNFIDEYIDQFELAIVRTSAIGKEAVIRGIPTIIVLLSKADQTISVDFIQDKYKKFQCFVSSFDQLSKVINNYTETVSDFLKYRDLFITDNHLDQDVFFFRSKLKEFGCS